MFYKKLFLKPCLSKTCLVFFLILSFGSLEVYAQLRLESNQILRAPLNDDYVGFGETIAIDGTRAIIGTFPISSKPEVFIYEQNSSGFWRQETSFSIPDSLQGRLLYGTSDISGNIAVVGAPTFSFSNRGWVYIYERNAQGIWEEDTIINVVDNILRDDFGIDVAVSGNTIIVGASFDADLAGDRGSAYIFERNTEGIWEQVIELRASNPDPQSLFGRRVDISGSTAVVAGGIDDILYVFEQDPIGNWQPFTQISPIDENGNPISVNGFGTSVALEGDKLIVGSPLENTRRGATYIFERKLLGWEQIAKLEIVNSDLNDRFGSSVAISDSMALVGARFADNLERSSGLAYLFKQNAQGIWEQASILSAPDENDGDGFGQSVALSGSTAMVGAPENAVSPRQRFPNVGAVYTFENLDNINTLPFVEEILLVDAAKDEILGSIQSGDTIDLANFEDKFDLMAITKPSKVRKVRFSLFERLIDGRESRFILQRLENNAPYVLGSNRGSDVRGVEFTPGAYGLFIFPLICETFAQQCPGTFALLNFTVVDSGSEVNQLAIFPNTTQGLLRVKTELNRPAPGAFQLYNARGELISEQTFNQQLDQQMDLTHLPNGLYLGRLIVKGKAMETQRILLSK